MHYVIKRTDHGREEYVADPGGRSSFTSDIRKARTFFTRETAQREACPGNEYVVEVRHEMMEPRQ